MALLPPCAILLRIALPVERIRVEAALGPVSVAAGLMTIDARALSIIRKIN
jgi:hypothetical protein